MDMVDLPTDCGIFHLIGYQTAIDRFLPVDGTFSLNCYQAIALNQDVFHTDSAGDSLKVCILAYKQNDPLWLTAILMPALAEIERGLAQDSVLRDGPAVLGRLLCDGL